MRSSTSPASLKPRHIAEFLKVNVEGTRHVAAALAEVSPDLRVIHVSSLAAREPGLSPYCASKRGGEDAIEALPNPARMTILRPPAVLRPGRCRDLSDVQGRFAGLLHLSGRAAEPGFLIHGADLAAAIVAADGGARPRTGL